MKYTFLSKKLKDTKKIAKWLSKRLESGDVICLTGDLGAGKTTFTKCLLKYLGVKDIVSSPTFTIIKHYVGKKFEISHLDLYRLVTEEELREIGLEELIDSKDIVIIEWPEIAKKYLKNKSIKINISFDEDQNRVFDLEF